VDQQGRTEEVPSIPEYTQQIRYCQYREQSQLDSLLLTLLLYRLLLHLVFRFCCLCWEQTNQTIHK